ncbi:hypothetical protein Q1695_014151 [Nippostrongylus brasiliensis]|nr:hypothetical protein Q1695_014151 [Nippostrongylus brasiliensis]
MEQDFGRTIFDEIDDDDVIAHKEVSINKPFSLGGEDFEMSGLEPYVYLRYNCNGDYQEEVINLGDSLFTSRVFTLMKNLDTGETIIV